MPKVAVTKMRKLAKQYEKNGIVTDDKLLKCELCDVTINVDEKHQSGRIVQHIKAPKHIANQERHARGGKTATQPFIATALEEKQRLSEFNLDLAGALLQSGIPLNKVNCVPLKHFLEKYTKKNVPDQSTLRKYYVNPHASATLEKIRDIVGSHPVYLEVDETTDELQRMVLGVLVAPLHGKPVQPMLLKLYCLEKANASTVMQSVTDACSILWPGGIQYDKVWLLLSDQVPYMLSAGNNLKLLFPNMKHVSCLAHALHRVCETIRVEYSKANDFISQMKKILKKCPARIQLYRETTQLPLPPEPVITRWGTWIKAGVFFAENFQKISEFIDALEDHAAAVKKVKELAKCKDVQDELYATHAYKYLPAHIAKLEERGLSTERQWEIMCEAKESLDGFALEKFTSSISKNPDLNVLVSNTSDLEFRVKTKFAPLVSVDIERFFSQYRDTLSSRRRRFLFENLEKVLVVRYNSFFWSDTVETESK